MASRSTSASPASPAAQSLPASTMADSGPPAAAPAPAVGGHPSPVRVSRARSAPIHTLDAETLLARAALWRWAARAFWYPEPEFEPALRGQEWRHTLAEAAATGAWPDPSSLAGALGSVWTAADALGNNGLSLAEEHTALFARQVPVPLHGTVYGADLGSARTQDLARVASFYEAFGFQVSSARAELADHLSVELEFVAALLAKEAYARTRGPRWRARAARVARAHGLFLDEHLLPWFDRFVDRLSQHRRLDFYPAVAGLVSALLAPERAP